MFGRRKQTSMRIDTLVGKTAHLKGDLVFSGGLHLDGRVDGNVISIAEDGGALSVSETGFIEGRVEVTNIIMNGTVNGDMVARERLVLGGKARVNGNVHYGVIEMAPGAVITGKLIPLLTDKSATAGNGEPAVEPVAETASDADSAVAAAKSRA
ncbi:MAG TPA: polymer-forming cytoskeletal protein [Steroidobacteraceae bacterium]|nr:polymer-forming cytoskeletal protein [Steroidobacteraceae bacterium]